MTSLRKWIPAAPAACALAVFAAIPAAATTPPVAPPSPPAATAAPAPPPPAPYAPKVVYSGTSPYHSIRVVDNQGLRIMYFDDTMESRMNIGEPLTGQFEYTDYFHMGWLWNPQIKNVLMLGIGGASIPRLFAHYYPGVTVQTVEIDPLVAAVAKQFFHYAEGPRQKLALMDGRLFLRRTTQKYDLILLDAYTQGRYGASIPPHLVTKEFFEICRVHLNPDGVLAYNVISIIRDFNTDIVAALYRTLKEVFPQVYVFHAQSSANVVLLATLDKEPRDLAWLRTTAAALVESKAIQLPEFLKRVESFQPGAPANYLKSPVLTDDYAPVESLMRSGAAGTQENLPGR